MWRAQRSSASESSAGFDRPVRRVLLAQEAVVPDTPRAAPPRSGLGRKVRRRHGRAVALFDEGDACVGSTRRAVLPSLASTVCMSHASAVHSCIEREIDKLAAPRALNSPRPTRNAATKPATQLDAPARRQHQRHRETVLTPADLIWPLFGGREAWKNRWRACRHRVRAGRSTTCEAEKRSIWVSVSRRFASLVRTDVSAEHGNPRGDNNLMCRAIKAVITDACRDGYRDPAPAGTADPYKIYNRTACSTTRPLGRDVEVAVLVDHAAVPVGEPELPQPHPHDMTRRARDDGDGHRLAGLIPMSRSWRSPPDDRARQILHAGSRSLLMVRAKSEPDGPRQCARAHCARSPRIAEGDDSADGQARIPPISFFAKGQLISSAAAARPICASGEYALIEAAAGVSRGRSRCAAEKSWWRSSARERMKELTYRSPIAAILILNGGRFYHETGG